MMEREKKRERERKKKKKEKKMVWCSDRVGSWNARAVFGCSWFLQAVLPYRVYLLTRCYPFWGGWGAEGFGNHFSAFAVMIGGFPLRSFARWFIESIFRDRICSRCFLCVNIAGLSPFAVLVCFIGVTLCLLVCLMRVRIYLHTHTFSHTNTLACTHRHTHTNILT